MSCKRINPLPGVKVFFNRAGERVEFEEWQRLFEPAYRQVRIEPLRNYTVSTVWAGYDLDRATSFSWSPDEVVPERIFETAVFRQTSKEAKRELVYRRYADTEEQAVKNHIRAIWRWDGMG